MTAKRNTTSTCPHCGKSFRQDGIGRTRLFCSDACKTAAHRAAQRQHRATHYAEVSAHYLAGEIGTYEGSGDYAGADALRRLAAHHRLTLDEARITAKRTEAERLQHSLDALSSFVTHPL